MGQAGSGAGAAARRWAIHSPSSLPKILQQQAALLAAAQGPGLGPVAAVAAQMQHVAAFSLVATPLLPAAGTDWGERGTGEAGKGQEGGCGLTLPPPPPPAANSPPGGGPGALPGLPAPFGVNGFNSLTPQTNGQPGPDTLYNNGLSPYPGGPPPAPAPPKSPRNGVRSGGEGEGIWGSWEEQGVCVGGGLPGKDFSSLPVAFHPANRQAFTVVLYPSLPSPEPRCG